MARARRCLSAVAHSGGASDIAFAGIARQAELLRKKDVSSRELVELYLERIARLDPQLNAFRTVMGERALLEAEQADARLTAGDDRPLLGVPIAIKDGWDVAGELTTHGTGAYGPPASEDATFVSRLRGAGAVIVGKTLQPELAAWMFTESATWGVTRNPWDPDRTPGGSSGGSGAAVAAGLVGAASASDGLGSTRIPAAACGLFGLKPSRGRVPLWPYSDHWHGLSVAGTLTRTVRDTALWLDVVSGPSERESQMLPAPGRSFVAEMGERPERLRIAVSLRAPNPVAVSSEVRSAVEGTADLLRSLGHEVRERDPNYDGTAGIFPFWISLVVRYACGVRDDVAAMPRPDRLERRTKGVARIGSLLPPRALDWARRAEAEHAARIGAVFQEHDLLLTPTVPELPIEVGTYEGRGAAWTMIGGSRGFGAPFTGAWNGTGQPAASVPAGLTAEGLPLAVQLIGRSGDEATILSVAAQLEAERPWADRLPPIS